jgi:hypothetical protein
MGEGEFRLSWAGEISILGQVHWVEIRTPAVGDERASTFQTSLTTVG